MIGGYQEFKIAGDQDLVNIKVLRRLYSSG